MPGDTRELFGHAARHWQGCDTLCSLNAPDGWLSEIRVQPTVLQIPPGAPAHMCWELIESLIASTLSLLRSACQARPDESALREGEAGGPQHTEPLLSPEGALNWRTDGI
ncbi:hypothetical protein XENOCAPTIV_001540 [Xenoophorus captivus]|uniref:Uncharacterized protein n=1 Tax=Xenoophorus captivus TaxID=1517983 RepID=A0ABV0S1I7_9TELE